jgi:hypothetical protein
MQGSLVRRPVNGTFQKTVLRGVLTMTTWLLLHREAFWYFAVSGMGRVPEEADRIVE